MGSRRPCNSCGRGEQLERVGAAEPRQQGMEERPDRCSTILLVSVVLIGALRTVLLFAVLDRGLLVDRTALSHSI